MKVINDPLFGDHFIQVDDYNYSVYKTKISKEEKKEYTSVVGHYSTMAQALTAMANDMVKDKNRESLESYVKELNEIYVKFENLKIK
jgi:hypothetical protein